MSLEKIPNIKFIVPTHRCHEYLLDFILATASFGAYFKVYHGQPVTTFAPAMKGGHPTHVSFLFSGIASQKHLSFFPHEIFVDVILKNTRNTNIAYVEEAVYKEVSGVTTHAGSMFGGFTNAMFIRYYEDNQDNWKSQYGGDQDTWPEVLRFARIVRNCMSHGGKIEIRNPKERPVNHFGLTYSHKDNGNPIRPDLGPADIFYLMLDMDAVF